MTREEALRVLGLEEGVSRAEINTAYRELAQMLHPDKYGSNQRLRKRAERQMATINEARDTLLKGARQTSDSRTGTASRSNTRSAAAIADEADAHARAAEAARLMVAQEIRTLSERRGSMMGLTAVSALVLVITFRMSGVIGNIIQSVALMLVVWGIYDVVVIGNQTRALNKRAAELIEERDRARRVANEARALQ